MLPAAAGGAAGATRARWRCPCCCPRPTWSSAALVRPVLLGDVAADPSSRRVALSAALAAGRGRARRCGRGGRGRGLARRCGPRRAGAARRGRWSAGTSAQFAQWAADRQRHELRGLGGRSAGCCRRARSSRASSPTGWRSRTASSRIFVGRGFGNYDDRLQRDDVRYILTYDLPERRIRKPGRSGLIQEILDAIRNRRIIATFDVDETPRRRSRRAHRQAARRYGRTSDRSCARLDDDPIKAHADRRFRSEYDYALFEYYRSAKVIAFLERAGVRVARPRARRRLRRRRHAAVARRGGATRSSASIRSIASATPACGSARERGLRNLHFAARRRHGAAVSRPAPSTWCCRTPSSSTSPTRRCTCANAARVLRRAAACICRRRRTCRSPARTCRG